MPYFTNYHLGEQGAYALLGPINATLGELERRTEHYTTRLAMGPQDRAALQAALRVLAAAHTEVERLLSESRPAPPVGKDVRPARAPGQGDRA